MGTESGNDEPAARLWIARVLCLRELTPNFGAPRHV